MCVMGKNCNIFDGMKIRILHQITAHAIILDAEINNVGGSSPRLSAHGLGLGERVDDFTIEGIFTRSL